MTRPSTHTAAFFYSLLLHLSLVCVLVLNFEFSSPMPVVENTANAPHIINAQVVNAPAALNPAPVKPQVTPPPPSVVPPAVIKAAAAPSPKVKEAIIALKKPIRKKVQPVFKPQDLLKDLQKQKKAKQALLEKSFAKQMHEQAEKNLEQQLAGEQRIAQSAKTSGEVNKYKALILQEISRRWLVPEGVNKNLYSILMIRLAPGGMVLDVQITKSSGNANLDRSARDAIFTASPLPVPSDTQAFAPFRQFVLKVRPKDLIQEGI